jgi:hypothetical protein
MSIDWTKISEKYKGMWVALKDDQVSVIASGKTLKEVSKKAKEKGYDNPAFTRIPNKFIVFAGAN